MSVEVALGSCSRQIGQLEHDLRGVLNIIAFAAANVQVRPFGGLANDERAYLISKMERIELQVERSRKLLDALGVLAQRCPVQTLVEQEGRSSG